MTGSSRKLKSTSNNAAADRNQQQLKCDVSSCQQHFSPSNMSDWRTATAVRLPCCSAVICYKHLTEQQLSSDVPLYPLCYIVKRRTSITHTTQSIKCPCCSKEQEWPALGFPSAFQQVEPKQPWLQHEQRADKSPVVFKRSSSKIISAPPKERTASEKNEKKIAIVENRSAPQPQRAPTLNKKELEKKRKQEVKLAKERQKQETKRRKEEAKRQKKLEEEQKKQLKKQLKKSNKNKGDVTTITTKTTAVKDDSLGHTATMKTTTLTKTTTITTATKLNKK